MDDWRILLYPLGFLSGLAFGARFIVQWLQSERAHQSVVTRSFWHLSLLGNLLLLIHSLIQIQAQIGIVQACNAVISWRNLNLIQTKRPPVSFAAVICLLVGSILLTCLAFQLEGGWFRIPTAPWQSGDPGSISFVWHAIGTLAYLLFSSRFWIQWWLSERAQASSLPLCFWWLSLGGALLSIPYFIKIGDTVNLIGPMMGIVPYIRNLMLMKKIGEAA